MTKNNSVIPAVFLPSRKAMDLFTAFRYMEKQTDPNSFLVVLTGEIIEIPQGSGKSWLTLCYSLLRELAEKWKPAYELPHCPYAVLRTDKYDHIERGDTKIC